MWAIMSFSNQQILYRATFVGFLASRFLCSTFLLLQVCLEAESVVIAELEVSSLVFAVAEPSPEIAVVELEAESVVIADPEFFVLGSAAAELSP